MGSLAFRFKYCELDDLLLEAQGDGGKPRVAAVTEIIQRFEPLTMKIARSVTSDRDLQEDVANAARQGLVAAIRRHDLTRPGFPSYAERFMRGAAGRERHQWLRNQPVLIDVTDPEVRKFVERPIVDLLNIDRTAWGEGQTAQVVAELPAAGRQLLADRYILDLSLAEISKASGTTVSAVSQRLRTVHKAMAAELAA
jgi:RNA polymerase sigma factor (sigma-70 family)